jgi:hypothetical protein
MIGMLGIYAENKKILAWIRWHTLVNRTQGLRSRTSINYEADAADLKAV